jgi:hypothetical protein
MNSKEQLLKLRDIIIQRTCRHHKPMNIFESDRENELIIKEEFEDYIKLQEIN